MNCHVSDLLIRNRSYTHLVINSYPLQQPFIKACNREGLALVGGCLGSRATASILPALELLRNHYLEPCCPVFTPKMIADRRCLAGLVLPYFTINIRTNNFNEIRFMGKVNNIRTCTAGSRNACTSPDLACPLTASASGPQPSANKLAACQAKALRFRSPPRS